MTQRRPTVAVAGACALVALLTASAVLLAALRRVGWSLSGLVRVDAGSALGAAARLLDPGFHTVRSGAYDGQFYWGVAVDPLTLGRVHLLLDKPSYRYGHPLYGWLASLVSGGSAAAVPAALTAIGVLSLCAGAAVAVALGRRQGGRGLEGLFVALNLGLLSSLTNDLAEPLAAALLLGAFWALAARRPAVAWCCFALLPLAKEPLLVAPLAVVAWELAHRRTRRAAYVASTMLPALLWWTFARIRLGAWFTTGDTALGAPLHGWLRSLGDNAGSVVLVLLLVVLAAGCVRAARSGGPIGLTYLGLAVFAACLAPNATHAVTTALRNTAFLVVLLPFVAVRPGAAEAAWGGRVC